MKPAPHDPRDYLLDELSAAERAQFESYLAAEPAARSELESLRIACESLRELPGEEPPRRIAFVSDKIFEPSPVVRLWSRLWADGPRFAFGAAAMLGVLFAGLWATQPRLTVAEDGWTVAFGPVSTQTAPAPEPAPAPTVAALDEARVRAIFEEVVAESEARNRTAAAELVRASSAQTRAELKRDIEAAQADMRSGLRIVHSNYEQLYRYIAQPELAVAR